ncbi:MAG: ABC transporter permease [Promethearchaeota archaeon]
MEQKITLQIWYLTIKNFKSMIRDKAQLVWLIGYPLLFMVLYRFAFEEVVFALMAPGLLVAGPTIIISQLAQHFAEEKELGTLQRLDTTPVSRNTILISGLLSQLIIGVIQIALFLILIFVFTIGNPEVIHPDANLFLMFFIPFLVTFSSLGFGLLLASFVKTGGSASGIAWFIILPLQFLGGVITYPAFLPFIPTGLAVDALRSVMSFEFFGSLTSGEVVLNMIYILIWGVAVSLLGMILFQRKTAIL